MASVDHFVKISKWGLSLGIRIPRDFAKKYNFSVGETLKLTALKQGFVAEKTVPSGEMYYI